MAAELGIGVRVRLGWVPNERLQPFVVSDPRLQCGTIKGGPFSVGDWFHRPQTPGIRTINGGPSVRWRVDMDDGQVLYPIEPVIFPIDDGEYQTTRDEREPVEAEA